MRKITFAINVSLDGYADHEEAIADEELHCFHTNLLKNSDTIIFGRKTYQLMEDYWPNAYNDPNADKSTFDFADVINSISKIVITKTLTKTNWSNTRIINDNIIEEILKLKNSPGKNIGVGGISTASFFMNNNLIDEFWLLIHPKILGKGKKLFSGLQNKIDLKLKDIQKFKSDVVVLHYEK